LDPRGRKWQEVGENCIMRSFIVLTVSPNIIRTIKWQTIRWTGHLACMGQKETHTEPWFEVT
jgi:hypothetical protein